jgi:hypothetical protein
MSQTSGSIPPPQRTLTTTTPDPPHPSYTFYWICPRPSCHTCSPAPRPIQPLSSTYFNDYQDMQQLAQDWEVEEIGAAPLSRCTRNCRARQMHTSNEPRTVCPASDKLEWHHVNAKCGVCGRVAGRGSALVEVGAQKN